MAKQSQNERSFPLASVATGVIIGAAIVVAGVLAWKYTSEHANSNKDTKAKSPNKKSK